MEVLARFETPYERSGIITPGLPVLQPGVERHPVPGGGSRAIPVDRGDEICVLDFEGKQPVEIVFFASDGRSDPGLIGASGNRRPFRLAVHLGG